MNAPAPTEVEVSLIGPGYGESIVIHVGDGEWIVVDSCFQRSNHGPAQSAALAYLRSIGVDPTQQVSHIIATHWHDDHIGGLSQVVDECAAARFCCSIALRQEEFLGFATDYAAPDPSPIARATREIIDILERLEKRNKVPTFLVPDRLIFRTSRKIEAYALSPSDQRIKGFLATLAANLPKRGGSRKWVGDMSQNAAAVALFIGLGNDGILLGADVEETPGGAWSTIVTSCEAPRSRRSSVYKVAHHGSETGEYEGIWKTLLIEGPYAVLTPFSRGPKPRPSADDVDRILSRTTRAYSSARLSSTAPRRRDPSVERTIRESGWKFRAAEPKQGQVRLRRDLSSEAHQWTVDLMGNATELRHVRS